MSEHPKKVVLLDLDGTLTKSDPGIIGCVVKAFEEMGYPVPDDAELHRFIGPAISESMQRNGIPDDKLDEGVRIYRKYYADEAVFDDPNNPGQKVPGRLNNTIYQGIPEQLAKLRADGYYLAIASCKPQYQCIPICEHFHLDTMVDGIYGASEDNSVLTRTSDPLGFPAHRFRRERRRQALMVGDRWTDADGARRAVWTASAVAGAMRSPGELKAHGAYRILDSVDELAQAVEEYFA